MNERIKDARQKIKNCQSILESSSPQSIFERGYSMVKTKDGVIVRNAAQIAAGDEIEIRPAEGIISAVVKNTK